MPNLLPANESILDVDVGGMPDPEVRKEIGDLIDSMKTGIAEDKVRKEDGTVRHIFSKGVYCREMVLPKGMLIVGKIHKTSHINIISAGHVTVKTQFGTHEYKAPFTFISQVGTQRVVFAHEETVWTTIHPSDKTDLEELESDIIAEHYDEILALEEDKS